MLADMDCDSDGQISLEEWVKGGMNNIPFLVLMGMEIVSPCLLFFFSYFTSFLFFEAWGAKSYSLRSFFIFSIIKIFWHFHYVMTLYDFFIINGIHCNACHYFYQFTITFKKLILFLESWSGRKASGINEYCWLFWTIN